MSFELVKQYFEQTGMGERVMEFHQSSATVPQAANAVGCEPQQIAKTLSFLLEEQPLVIVAAGDAKVDNQKYKAFFHQKPKMIPWESVETYTGHAPGGVCPFVLRENVRVYLDISLKRFSIIYPACGSDSSAVRLSPEELALHAAPVCWVDVCKDWNTSVKGEHQ